LVMSMEDRFHLKEVNHQELLSVLLSFFNEGMGTEKGYRYRENEKVFLDLQLDKSGTILRINPSNEFPSEKISKIEASIIEWLIDNQTPRIGEGVGFSTRKVKGYFRYKDLFEIIPMPDSAPQPEVLIADHPFLVQFSYISSSNPRVDSIRQREKLNVYIRLLNLFSNSVISLGPNQKVRIVQKVGLCL